MLAALDDVQATRDRATSLLNRAASDLGLLREQLAALRADVDEADLGPVAEDLATLDAVAARLVTDEQRLRDVPLGAAVIALAQGYETRNAPFYAMRQAQQQLNEALKQQHQLSRQIEHLERKERELEAASREEAELLRKRDEARGSVARIDDEIFRLRIAEVEDINRAHGDAVALTLKSGASSPAYTARISGLLTGSRIRNQDDVAKALAATFDPSALIDVVETGTGQRFAETLQRDLGQMNRVVAHLSEHPDLYTLEAEPVAAKLEITLFDNGTPKPVETLSKGQKATALLPLILRPLPYPLVIDQPEDDLDNNFIFNALVRHIAQLKEARQLVFITHNANIPVLGGADRVVVMQMQTPTSAAPCLTGTVDERRREILDLLEGGAEAFQRREQRYHDLLPGSDR